MPSLKCSLRCLCRAVPHVHTQLPSPAVSVCGFLFCREETSPFLRPPLLPPQVRSGLGSGKPCIPHTCLLEMERHLWWGKSTGLLGEPTLPLTAAWPLSVTVSLNLNSSEKWGDPTCLITLWISKEEKQPCKCLKLWTQKRLFISIKWSLHWKADHMGKPHKCQQLPGSYLKHWQKSYLPATLHPGRAK